uniref:Uncharacterized protein n=1 Tax=Alexandrium catenella TaxID=2925 RepID=A0A7S1WWC2_ALECA
MDSSLGQVRDTLQNLQRSVEDAGRDVDSLFAGRQRWCEESLRGFAEKKDAADTSLRHMSVDVKEQQAAVEEAEGTAFQLKADIAIVRKTLNKTMEMLKAWRGEEAAEKKLNATVLLGLDGKQKQLQADESLLESLVHNKQQTLAALEGEEEVVLPMLAQLQASVVEMRVQLADRSDSVARERRFAATLRDACSRSSDRAALEAAARAKTAEPIAAAIQALQRISASRAVSQSSVAASLAPEALSFLQQGEERAAEGADEDLDLLTVFGGHSAPSEGAKRSVLAQQDEASVDAAPVPQRPKIQRMLTDLRARGHLQDDQAEWCAEEQSTHERVIVLAQASISEMEAELNVHADSSDQIAASLQLAESSNEKLHAAIQDVSASFAKEQALIASGAKDQALATRILEQAMEILEDLKASDDLVARGEQGAGNVTGTLQAAGASFKAQAQMFSAVHQEVVDMAQKLAREAQEAIEALEHEHANLELARDSHSSERRRCTENKATYQSDIEEAQVYLKSLQDECSSNISKLEEREQEAEIRALQDSQAVLEGRQPVAGDRPQGARGLRGTAAHSSSKTQAELSPLQRAAEEMGLTVDDS